MNRFLKRVKNYSFLSFLGHFSIFLFYTAGFFILFVALVFAIPIVQKYGFLRVLPDYSSDKLLDFHSSFLRFLVVFSFFTGFLTTLITALLKFEFAVSQFLILFFFGLVSLRILPAKFGWSLTIESFPFRFSLIILTSLFLSFTAFFLFRSFYQKKRSYSLRHNLGNFLACLGFLFINLWFNQWWQAPLKKTSNVVDERFKNLPTRSSENLQLLALTKLQQDYQYLKSHPVTDFGEKPPGFTYLVKPGDSYWKIAQEMLNDPLRWKEIANQKNFAGLQPGDQLNIPLKNKDYPQYLDYLVDEWIFPGQPLAVSTHQSWLYLLVSNSYSYSLRNQKELGAKTDMHNMRINLLVFRNEDGKLNLISSTPVLQDLPVGVNSEYYGIRFWRWSKNCQELAIFGEDLSLQITQVCNNGKEVTFHGPTENKESFFFIDVLPTFYPYNFPTLFALTPATDNGQNHVVLLNMTEIDSPQIAAKTEGSFQQFVKTKTTHPISILGDGGLWGLTTGVIAQAAKEGTGFSGYTVDVFDRRHFSPVFKSLGFIEGNPRRILYCHRTVVSDSRLTLEEQEPIDITISSVININDDFDLLENKNNLSCGLINYYQQAGFYKLNDAHLYSEDLFSYILAIDDNYFHQAELPVADGLGSTQTHQTNSGLIYKIGCRRDVSAKNLSGRLIVLDFDK